MRKPQRLRIRQTAKCKPCRPCKRRAGKQQGLCCLVQHRPFLSAKTATMTPSTPPRGQHKQQAGQAPGAKKPPKPMAATTAAVTAATPPGTARQAAPGRVALWQQLQQAARMVQAVLQGHSAPTVLEQVPPHLRAGVQALGYQALRRLGMARWLREQLAPRTPPAAADALLCTALALAWEQPAPNAQAANQPSADKPCAKAGNPAPGQPDASASMHVHAAALAKPDAGMSASVEVAGTQADDDDSRGGNGSSNGAHSSSGNSPQYNDFTLAHQAVEAARRHPRMRHQAGLINACLRAFMRERAAWQARCRQASPQGCPELLNLPAWWWQRLQADHPASAQTVALAGQQLPPMHLRVNARQITPAQYLHQHLQPAGIAGVLHGEHGVLLRQPCPVQQLPGFAQGWVSVQDAAAQLAAPLLLRALQTRLPKPAWRLLDACAAPGGKTAHLLELGDHDVTALEIDAARCERMADTLQRLRLSARLCVADAARPDTWWNGQLFDGILLDAPCSASGIVRRHPDIAWLRREQDIEQLARTQQQLLQALWPLLRPGGVLLYATCSVFRAEGQAQIDTFLLHHSDAVCLPAPGHLLPAALSQHAGLGQNGASRLLINPAPSASAQAAGASQWLDHDGFYYALLAKTA